MSRLPNLGGGFLQAPDTAVRVITPQVPGPGTIVQAARARSTVGDVLNFLGTGLAAADETLKIGLKFQAVDEGRGAEAAMQDFQAMRAAIESDDPSWDFSIWDTADDGTVSIKSSDQIRAEISARLPIPANASAAFRKGYIDRLMPGLESDIYDRGLQRRADFVDGQLGLLSSGILSKVTQPAPYLSGPGDSVATDHEGNPIVLNGQAVPQATADYMDQAYNEARLLLPQQSMESDEAYELRLAGTIYEKVLRPVIPGAIKAGRYDALEMMWNSPYLDEAMRADLADTVRSGHYENTLYAFQSPQMSALNDGLVYNLPGTDKQVWANPGMNGYGIDEYLQEDFIQNPDSLFYMTPSRVDAIRKRFLEQSESDLELIRTVGAGAGRNTLPVRSKQLEAMGPEYFNTIDPETGWISNGLGTGMVLSQHGMVSDEVNELLWTQLNNDNQQVQMQAVQAMVFMAAWPDADSQGSAWSEIKRKAMDNPLNEQIVLMVERIASDHAIFPHDVQGTAKVQEVDLNVASDKIYEMIQSNMFQEAPTREQLDRAGQVLGLTTSQMRYSSAQTQAVTEKVVEATEAWMWTQDPALDVGANHDLVVDNPYLQRVLSNKYMQFVTQHSGNMNLSDDQIKAKADADFKRYLQGKFDVVGLSNNSTERASLVPLPAGWPEERRWNTNTEARVKKEIDKLDLGWDIERGNSNWDQVDQLVPSLHPEFGWGYLLVDQDGMYLTADVNKDGELTPVWINTDVNRIAEADRKALADELRGTRSRDQWKRQAAEGFWSVHPGGVSMRGIMEMTK